MIFFGCGPFLLVPRVIGFQKIFCCRPRVCKVFFFCCAPLGAATFRRGQSKKKTPPRVFFCLLRPRGKAGEGEAPCRHGARAKERTPPVPAPNGASLCPAFPQGRSKKKKTPGWCFLFCSGPVPAPNGASPSLAFRRGRNQKKKHPGWCSFFCSGPVPARGFSFPCLSPGPEQKKNTPGWCCFLLRPRTDAHSLTAGLGGDASPSRGGVFFFAAAPPGPGWCFFFLLWPRPDAHSLTVGWGDFGKARVVFFFFAAAPPGLFRQ